MYLHWIFVSHVVLIAYLIRRKYEIDDIIELFVARFLVSFLEFFQAALIASF